MKKCLEFFLAFFVISSVTSNSVSAEVRLTTSSKMENTAMKITKIRLHIGTNRLSAALFDNPSTKQLLSLFPLTIQMKDLQNNEKYYDLSGTFPTQASKPDNVKAGDIMLYGPNTLVVFYETFSTAYSYTKLGEIDDPSKLKSILGQDAVEITFEAD